MAWSLRLNYYLARYHGSTWNRTHSRSSCAGWRASRWHAASTVVTTPAQSNCLRAAGHSKSNHVTNQSKRLGLSSTPLQHPGKASQPARKI